MARGADCGRGLLREMEGTCDLCGANCHPEAEICVAICCGFKQCTQQIYHQDCVEKYLSKLGLDKIRKAGFPCPRGRGKGTRYPGDECRGMVVKSHIIMHKKEKKKKAPPPVQPAPVAAKKPAAPAMPRKAVPASRNVLPQPPRPVRFMAPTPEVVEVVEEPEGPRIPVGMAAELTKAQKKNLKRKAAAKAANRAENSSEAGTAVTDGSADHTNNLTLGDWGVAESSSGSAAAAARAGQQLAPHEIMGTANFVSNADRYAQLLGLDAYVGDSDDDVEDDEEDEGNDGSGGSDSYAASMEGVAGQQQEAMAGQQQGPPSRLDVNTSAQVAAGSANTGAAAVGPLSSNGSSYENYGGAWEEGSRDVAAAGVGPGGLSAGTSEEEMVAMAMQLSLQEAELRRQQEAYWQAAIVPASGPPAVVGSAAPPAPASSMGLAYGAGVPVPVPMPVAAPVAGGMVMSRAMPVPTVGVAAPGLFDPAAAGPQGQAAFQPHLGYMAPVAAPGMYMPYGQQHIQHLLPPQGFFNTMGHSVAQGMQHGAMGVVPGAGGYAAAAPGVVAPAMATGHALAEVHMGNSTLLKVTEVEDEGDEEEEELQELLGLCGVTAA